MKASELIAEIAAVIQQHGDVEMGIGTKPNWLAGSLEERGMAVPIREVVTDGMITDDFLSLVAMVKLYGQESVEAGAQPIGVVRPSIPQEALDALVRLWGEDERRGGYIGAVDIPTDLFVAWFNRGGRPAPTLLGNKFTQGFDSPVQRSGILFDDGVIKQPLAEGEIHHNPDPTLDETEQARRSYGVILELLHEAIGKVVIERDTNFPEVSHAGE
jgi:hypothetical protein